MRSVAGGTGGGTYYAYTVRFALFTPTNRDNMYSIALSSFGPPTYSWKYRSSGTLGQIGLPGKRQFGTTPAAYLRQFLPEEVRLGQD